MILNIFSSFAFSVSPSFLDYCLSTIEQNTLWVHVTCAVHTKFTLFSSIKPSSQFKRFIILIPSKNTKGKTKQYDQKEKNVRRRFWSDTRQQQQPHTHAHKSIALFNIFPNICLDQLTVCCMSVSVRHAQHSLHVIFRNTHLGKGSKAIFIAPTSNVSWTRMNETKNNIIEWPKEV